MSRRAGFDSESARSALCALGVRLGRGGPIKILVIGGAAAHLIGVLPSLMTTGDVDAIMFLPGDSVEEVLKAAETVAEVDGLPRGWLNHDDAGLYAQAVPEGWKRRRREVGIFGRLRVYAISRKDLIAMKFYAHRQVDIEHLSQMGVKKDDLKFTHDYLAKLVLKLPEEHRKIEMARHLVNDWGSRHE